MNIWKFIDHEGKKVGQDNKGKDISTDRQIDDVGNIIQKSGAIQPIACQKCKVVFKSEIENVPLEQSIPSYSCKDCSFNSLSVEQALDHKIDTNHKLNKTSKMRVVGYNRKIKGEIAHIKTLDDDISILCKVCDQSG